MVISFDLSRARDDRETHRASGEIGFDDIRLTAIREPMQRRFQSLDQGAGEPHPLKVALELPHPAHFTRQGAALRDLRPGSLHPALRSGGPRERGALLRLRLDSGRSGAGREGSSLLRGGSDHRAGRDGHSLSGHVPEVTRRTRGLVRRRGGARSVRRPAHHDQPADARAGDEGVAIQSADASAGGRHGVEPAAHLQPPQPGQDGGAAGLRHRLRQAHVTPRIRA